MANHSDETQLAWVWSQYQGEKTAGAPVEVIEVSTIGGSVAVDEPVAAAASAAPTPDLPPSSAIGQGNGAAGPVLAALILTILGLLWFASADKKQESAVSRDASPDVSSGSAPVPVPPSPPQTSGQTATPAPAEPAPTARQTSPAPVGEHPAPRHRQQRHR